MARSDLLVALVKAGSAGDKRGVMAATEAIIAEERQKQHTILADRLSKAIQINGNGVHTFPGMTEGSSRGRDFLTEIAPKRQLNDLVLTRETRALVDQLVEEQHRAALLRAHGLEPRHRMLIVGPPGTGKTSLAEGIAEAISVPLFVVRYESMIGSYLGETAGRLKRVFDYARTIACVLFFDEFDAIGKERGDVHETGEIKRVVTSLLMQIDDLPSYTIIAAATNHPELLDRAAWRRFQIRLSMPMPSTKELAAYIDQFSKEFGEPLGQSTALIARTLGRISYAEAEQFCLDLRRRQVLSIGQKSLKAIVSEQLRFWAKRAKAETVGERRIDDATAPNLDTSST
jgi:SpoVK/Ycf46/Vps4 family AAA+-type ATPase